MSALGAHVLADMYDCDPAALDDEGLIREAMLEAARRGGATIVTHCLHRFSPHGVSGVVVIAESHLTIHTWPERGFAAIDLFTCGARLRPEVAIEHLAAALQSRRHDLRTVPRGAAALPTLALLNGNPAGDSGNTAAVLARLSAGLAGRATLRLVHLADPTWTDAALHQLIGESDGLVFATGTYWDSWGSPLQRFLEQATVLEAGPALLGKPAAVVVTMHSGGGEAVLSRLQGVLGTLGCLIPPMSGLVYSRAGQLATELATQHGPAEAAAHLDDLWQLAELDVVAHNLLQAIAGGRDYRSWRVDGGDARRRWVRP